MYNRFEHYGDLSTVDVVIQAGEYPDDCGFLLHSGILKEQSPYFHVALSTTWAKRENEKIILKKPNITPKVFRIVLKYFYTRELPLDQHDFFTILDLLVASDELLINELIDHIQNHFINVETKWLKENFSTVLHVALERVTCEELQKYCMDKICWNPKLIFDSEEFLSFEDYVLVSLLKHDNLQIEEIELWDYLIKWGVAQLKQQKGEGKDFLIDLLDRNEQVLQDLEKILRDCIPLIRFSEFSLGEFYDKIWPLKDILPSELKRDIRDFQKNPEIFPILPPRKPIISIDSVIIKPQQASKIPEWIEVRTNSSNSTRVRYEFKLLLRGTRDGFTPKIFHEKCDHKGPNVVVLKIRGSGQVIGGYNPIGWKSLKTGRWQYTKESFLFSFGSSGNLSEAKLSRITPGNEAIYDDPSFGPCFGKTDLDMRRQFNEDENCSAKMRCYKHAITNTTKFAVDDYEVFQVLCHTRSKTETSQTNTNIN